MFELPLAIGLIIIIGLVVRYARASSLSVVIDVRPGSVKVIKGVVQSSVLREIKEVARHYPFKGKIKGEVKNSRFTLTFPKNTPDWACQRIRNVFPFESYSSKTIQTPSPSPDSPSRKRI